MKKVLAGVVILVLPGLLYAGKVPCPALAAESQARDGQSFSPLSLKLTTVMDVPLEESQPVFEVGAGLLAGMEYRLPFLRWVYISGEVGFHEEAANLVTLSVSVFTAALGVGLRVDLLPWLSASAGVSGGAFGCILNDPGTSGGNALLSADVRLVLLPGPWRLTLGVSYQDLLSFYRGLGAMIGLSCDLPARARREVVTWQR
ncbi:MAG TPA: hypothetical protein VFI08_11985 [Spirochaetia bacterium]|nr:hypothetical protein [Spirochaetia bacterium]